MNEYRGKMTEEVLEELRKKNEEKLQKAKEYLGEKWILHPVHSIQKKKYPRKVRVYKNGIETGWFKDPVVGLNTIKAHCEFHKDDITQFEFRSYDNPDIIVWSGK